MRGGGGWLTIVAGENIGTMVIDAVSASQETIVLLQ